jgi:hypothetical protein
VTVSNQDRDFCDGLEPGERFLSAYVLDFFIKSHNLHLDKKKVKERKKTFIEKSYKKKVSPISTSK